MTEDAELLLSYAASGSQEAFAEFVRRHIGLVYSAAMRRLGGDAHAALDVSQQVFIAASRRAAVLARCRSVSAWLYTTTRNAALNALRTEQRRRRREQEVIGVETDAPERDTPADWERLRPILDDAMDALNDRDREAVLMRFFAGRSFAEIGARLELTENAARMRVERALERLRMLLDKRGLTSTSVALGLALTNHAAAAAPPTAAATVAGAVAAGGLPTATAGIFALMATSKLATTTAGVGLTIVLGTAIVQIQESRAAAARIKILQVQNAALTERIREAERATSATGPDSGAPDSLVNTNPAAFPPLPSDPLEAGKALLEAHPELKPLLEQTARATIATRYYPFYTEAGLSEVQMDEFEQIMSAGRNVLTMQLGERGTVKFLAGEALTKDEKNRRLRGLLGDDGYERWQEFQTMDFIVTRLAGAMCSTETPLTAEQGRRLAATLSRRGADVRADRSNIAQYNAMSVQEAQLYLSAEQLEVLKSLQLELLYVASKPSPLPQPQGNR